MQILKKILLSISLSIQIKHKRSIINRVNALKSTIETIENNNRTFNNKIFNHNNLNHSVKVIFSCNGDNKIVHASSGDSEYIQIFKNEGNREELLYSYTLDSKMITERFNPKLKISKKSFINSVLDLMHKDCTNKTMFSEAFLA